VKASAVSATRVSEPAQPLHHLHHQACNSQLSSTSVGSMPNSRFATEQG
jgi:hypothetical protein